MSKTKRPPHDYDADLRVHPLPDENMTNDELLERFERGVKSLFRGDPPRRSASTEK